MRCIFGRFKFWFNFFTRKIIPLRFLFNNDFSNRIKLPQKVTVKNCTLSDGTIINEGGILRGVLTEGNVTIGKYSSLWGPNIELHSGCNSIILGNFCSVAKNTSIYCYNHNISRPSSYFFNKNIFFEQQYNDMSPTGDVVIGNDVWIGTNVVILGGVTIGDGAVVGASSVVTKNIPSYAICAGNPAKIIKYRFSQHIIDKMNEIQWWNWSIDKIKENKLFFNSDVNENVDTIFIGGLVFNILGYSL